MNLKERTSQTSEGIGFIMQHVTENARNSRHKYDPLRKDE